MSSLYPRTKELTRTRKSLSDSPPSSPSPTAKSFRHDRASRLDSGSGSGDSATDRLLGRTSSYTRRENRLASLSKADDDASSKDFKKMYEDALAENEKLKSRLEDSRQELASIRTQLEKVTQGVEDQEETPGKIRTGGRLSHPCWLLARIQREAVSQPDRNSKIFFSFVQTQFRYFVFPQYRKAELRLWNLWNKLPAKQVFV
ncbi:protein phosphatase 1 regulatory subunit 12B isoform X8 [Anguilla rostrata]|uniref:protein phosphatase 1 regulatory subunit 12B isoform X8 n=1 Tax=Anguilla rostrata TaxID=7938 RepID=UPI0030CE4545